MRYKDIKKMLNNITNSVLSDMLKDFILHDMISRKQYNEISMRVEYSLTKTGKGVLPILKQICDWSLSHKHTNIDNQLPIYEWAAFR
jgi:DNA-binding HxlR family transcriptional regulator